MRRPLALAAVSLLLTACSDGTDVGVNEGGSTRGTVDGVDQRPVPTDAETTDVGNTETTNPGVAGTAPVAWRDLGNGTEEGHLQVPLDHDHPDGRQITLYIARHRALDPANRIGTLLVNPGGPGYGGTGLAFGAAGIYGQSLLDRFDIVAWDPRGTGSSRPAVDCIDDYDRYFALDSSPDTPEERRALIQAGTDFGQACSARSGAILPYLSTEQSARDMDSIRAALGEAKISYFGFSYGSELGATWATLFPATVRAAVLDGAVDPTVDYLHQNIQQAAGFEAALDTFLTRCGASPSCAFHNAGNAAAAFDALSAAIDASPVKVNNQRTPVTQGVLLTAVAEAMYDEASWHRLENALADLQHGDGQGVLNLYDDYYDYRAGAWDNSLEAYLAIGCLDDPGSTGPDDLFTHEAEFAAAAPRLGRSWMAELTFCSVWPIKPHGRVRITGKGAGPILVVGTTGDAATPLQSTRHMAAALQDGHLVVVTADQHTGYGVNRCVDDTVDRYLVDPTKALPAETDCR
ncbi:MAG: alpha/beta hydrolase [Actinomycetota bacterium]